MDEMEILDYIIGRIVDNANDANDAFRKDPHDLFIEGRALAYFEIVDTIKTILYVNGIDMEKYGLK